jgi:multidrug efflux pump subunit AcrA (membrane-fusion protein)
MKNVKKIVIYAVIIAVVVGGVIAVKSKISSSSKNKTTQVVASKTSVQVQTAKTTEKNTGDTYKATLEANEQGIVTSKLAAKIVSVAVQNGQYVNVGDTIAALDDQDIQNNIKTAQAQIAVYEKQVQSSEQSVNSAQVAMEKLKINVDDAQHNYDRQKTLFEGKAISQTDFETSEKTLNSAKADYDSGNASIQTAEANIETAKANLQAQKVALEKSQGDLANTVIKAPISGVISGKSMNVGQMASIGTTLATVNDISSVYATIQVPQGKISNAKVGQATTVVVDGSDQTYNGTIQYMDSVADSTSRVFNCKVKIDNSDKSLSPGTYGKVTLVSDQKNDVITIPVNALVGNEGDYSVFINDNGTAKKTKVVIGQTDENNVEITSGIKDGDQIICTNTSTLQDGDEVDAVAKQDSGTDDKDTKQDGGAEDTASK